MFGQLSIFDGRQYLNVIRLFAQDGNEAGTLRFEGPLMAYTWPLHRVGKPTDQVLRYSYVSIKQRNLHTPQKARGRTSRRTDQNRGTSLVS